MSKRQNKNDITEMTIEGPLSDTNIVQKSNPLFSLWKSSLTLSEFKILDTYLSRINSREPESRTVIFEKGELEKLLGVVKINQPELDKRLEHLQGTIINIGEGKNIDKITLFERSQAIQDEYGIWEVRLTASKSAMKYIFDIEKIGYFRYQIRNIVKLKSLNSYILFLYFEHSLFGRTHAELRIDVEELKQMLGCNEPLYDEYKYFNQRILQRCQKEINEKTDISCTYSTIRKNRKVAVVVFDIEKKAKIESLEEFSEFSAPSLECDEKTKSEPEEPPVEENEYGGYESDDIYQYATLCKYEFDNEQMKEICRVISETDLPETGISRTFDEYDFLSMMYPKLCSYTDKRGLDNKRRFSYFMKMLESYKAEHIKV